MSDLRRAYAGITLAWDSLKEFLVEWWPYLLSAYSVMLLASVITGGNE